MDLGLIIGKVVGHGLDFPGDPIPVCPGLGHHIAVPPVLFSGGKLRFATLAHSLQGLFHGHGILPGIQNTGDPADGIGMALAHALAPEGIPVAPVEPVDPAEPTPTPTPGEGEGEGGDKPAEQPQEKPEEKPAEKPEDKPSDSSSDKDSSSHHHSEDGAPVSSTAAAATAVAALPQTGDTSALLLWSGLAMMAAAVLLRVRSLRKKDMD